MTTATMSTKGQIVIPAEVRERLEWYPGTILEVESRDNTIILRPIHPFPETNVEDLLGCLPYGGPPKTLAEMDEGIALGAQEAMKLDP